MTQTEEVSMTFESKTPVKQMNGADTGRRNQEEVSPTSTSPSSGRDGTSAGSVLAMGSTDSAGNTHDGGSSCGLVSSLFPSSCRGRAEAFARSLHRRLTSLGGENGSQDEFDLSIPNETSWLHPTTIKNGTNSSNNVNHVLDHQPRHSPESDLFYELEGELEENGIGSPAEEATAAELAHLLVNNQSLKINHHDTCQCTPDGPRPPGTSQDSGSDGVYSSPISGTTPENEESDAYYDPLSSDGEKRKDTFYDPISTSENEEQSTLSNGSGTEMIRVLRRKLEKNKSQESTSKEEDTSESSCSLQKNTFDISRLSIGAAESTDESSNGRSSVDTVSHDSLWSFDDSTLSESPVKSEVPPSSQVWVPKSHSDSDLSGRSEVNDIKLARRIEVVEEGADEVDFANSTSEEIEKRNSRKDELNLYVANGFGPVVRRKYEDHDNDRDAEKILASEEPSDTDTDHSTYSSSINIPGALSFDCASGARIQEPHQSVKNEVKLLINDELTLNSSTNGSEVIKSFDSTFDNEAQDKSSGKNFHLSADDNPEEEEEEEGEQRPPRVRRCSSLKTGKTPPGTPGRKKIVRFADVLGLDLADVRTFLDEIPKVPNSAYSDLIYDDIFHKESSPINCGVQSWSARYLDNSRTNSVAQKPEKTLVPLFQQPGGLPNFLDFVRDRRVCLENVLVSDPMTLCIKGTVRVCNFDFHKSVHIRYTLNSWQSYSDLQATYAPNSCDGFSDKFTFTLYCHTLRVGQRLEFAVRFQCKGTQYWDNNLGANYCFQCLPSSPPVGYIPITAPENTHDWSPMFY